MKIVSIIVFLLLIVTSTASAQWKKGDERVEDAPDRKSVNGFGGQLIIVENPREFIEEWIKPKTPQISTKIVKLNTNDFKAAENAARQKEAYKPPINNSRIKKITGRM